MEKGKRWRSRNLFLGRFGDRHLLGVPDGTDGITPTMSVERICSFQECLFNKDFRPGAIPSKNAPYEVWYWAEDSGLGSAQ